MLLVLATTGWADRIVRKDGVVLTGRIVSQTDALVTIETDKYGGKTTISVPMSEIESIERGKDGSPSKPPVKPPDPPRPKGPTYCVFPLTGQLGIEITAAPLATALNQARMRKVDYVVLYFDSSGGLVSEIEPITKVMVQSRDLRIVVLVRRALAASAVTAMACEDIYMEPGGMIGGGVPHTLATSGLPVPITGPLPAATRAMTQWAAKIGKHSELLAEGMLDVNLALSIGKQDGKIYRTHRPGAKPLKLQGQTLAFTATEAVACGLAKGVVDDVALLNAPLSVAAWKKVSVGGAYHIRQKAREAKDHQHRLKRAEAKRAYLAKIAPQLATLDRGLAAVRIEGKKAVAAKEALRQQHEAEIAQVDAEYWRARRDANDYDETNPGYAARLRRRAREIRDDRKESIRIRFQPQVATADAEINRLLAEKRALETEKKKLLAATPP